MSRWYACALLGALLWMAPAAVSADLEMVMKAPQGEIRGGDTVILDLYLYNAGDAPVTRELPLSLPCRIDFETKRVKTRADLDGEPSLSLLSIPAGGFAKRRYALTIPVYVRNTIRISFEELGANPITVEVTEAPPAVWPGEQIPLDYGETLAQSFLDAFSVHNPMYFLLGVDPGLDQSKFQFSFRYRLFNPQGYLAEKASWLTGFHIAYTQRSIWDLADDSKPFDDTSYIPELFYELPKINLNTKRIKAFGVQAGFEHESNGKGGDDSRSTNRVYIKPIMGIHLIDRFYLKIAPKVFTYVANTNRTNGDLMDYRGYFDLELGIVDPQSLALTSHLWWAKEGASVQIDLTYPMTKLVKKSLNLYLHAQYFNGYAETLLHYKDHQKAFRLGFSLVR